MSEITVYHYAEIEKYAKILATGALLPNTKFDFSHRLNDLPTKAHNPIWFGLQTPEPKEWTDNKEFPHLWKRLITHVAGIEYRLCESNSWGDEIIHCLALTATIDDLFIFDEAPWLRSRDHDAAIKSLETKIPLAQYKGGYCVPTIICEQPIPKEKILVVKTMKYDNKTQWYA